MNAEARRLGLRRHGLPHAARPGRARRALLGARRADAGAAGHGLADLPRARPAAGRDDPGAREPPHEQHAAGGLRRPRRRQDRAHRRGRLEPGGQRRARRRAAVRDPARGPGRGDSRSRRRAPARLGLRPLRAREPRARRPGVRPFGEAAGRRRDGPLGHARPGRAGARARRAAAPPQSARCDPASASATSSCAARAACWGASRWWPTARAAGTPRSSPGCDRSICRSRCRVRERLSRSATCS